jgi:hypothetical protein
MRRGEVFMNLTPSPLSNLERGRKYRVRAFKI